MGRFAFVFPLKFAVTLPNDPAVTVGGVLGLGAENPAAVGTKDLPGEGAGLTVPTAAAFTLLQLCLDVFPFPRLDDGRMAVLHIILRNLPFVDLGFLGEEIHRKGFLKQCGAFVCVIATPLTETTVYCQAWDSQWQGRRVIRKLSFTKFPYKTKVHRNLTSPAHNYGLLRLDYDEIFKVSLLIRKNLLESAKRL